MRILKMILFKPTKCLTIITVIVFSLLVLFSSCVNKDKNFLLQNNKQEKLENQDKKIAQFLVESTKINIQIVELSKEVQDNSDSIEVKELFKNQEASVFQIQNNISKIAEKKLIVLPIFSSVITNSDKKKEILKDSQFIDELINLLVSEVILFEKIKSEVNDKTFLAFQEQNKPILDKNLEEINALKVQNFLNN